MIVHEENVNQNHRFKNMVLSIIFAVGIWLSVVYINDPAITTRMSGLPIKYKGEQDLRAIGLTVADRPVSSSVSIKISGKRSDLTEHMDKIYVEVDLTQISSAGEYTLPTSVSLPSSKLTIEKTSADTLPVNIAPLVKKTIPIKVNQTGSNKDFFVKSIPVTTSAEITGTAEELENVSYGAVSLDISGIVQNYTENSMPYLMYDSNNNPISKSETITADISKTDVVNTVYKRKLLPIKVILDDTMSEQYILNTQKTFMSALEIEVGVTDEFVGNTVEFIIDRYTTKSEDFSYKPQIGLYVPDTVLPQITPVIEKRVTKQVTLPLTVLDVPLNVNAVYEQNITVTLSCGENVQTSEIGAHINLTGYSEPGVYDIPVVFSGECIEAPQLSIPVTISLK